MPRSRLSENQAVDNDFASEDELATVSGHLQTQHDVHVSTQDIHFPWQDVDNLVLTTSGVLQTHIDNIEVTPSTDISAALILSTTSSGVIFDNEIIAWDNEIYIDSDYFSLSPDYKTITVISGGLYRVGYQFAWENIGDDELVLPTHIHINDNVIDYSTAYGIAPVGASIDNASNFLYPLNADDDLQLEIHAYVSGDWWNSDWNYRKKFTIQADQVVAPGAAYDNSSNGTTTGSSITFSHTIGSQNNRVLVVGVAIEDGGGSSIAVSNITYDDQSLTKIDDETANPTGTLGRAELWYLLEADLPTAGSYSVAVTLSQDCSGAVAEAVSLYNIKQQPPEASATTANTSSSTISTDITTLTNNAWLIDVVECGNLNPFTPNAGQTERQDTGVDSMQGAMSTKEATSKGLNTMGWTNSDANRMAHVVAAFEAITTPHTDFPVYITTTDLDGKAKANGDDITFIDATGTILDYEIESYNSGILHAWVRLDELSSISDTEVYVYYGNTTATGTYANPTGVWSSSYEAVYHLTDASNDSTSNDRNATAEDTDDVSGKLAGAQNFVPVDEISVGTWSVAGQGLTIQCWASFDNLSINDPRVISKATGTAAQDHVWMLGLGGSGEQYLRARLKTGTSDGSGTTTLLASTDPVSDETYYLIALTYDGSNMRLLLNGSQVVNTAKTGNLRINSWNIAIGNNPGSDAGYACMDGKIDEIRISSVARSTHWLQTEYNNQNTPESFYQAGAEESNILAGAAYRINQSQLNLELVKLI